MNFYAAIEKAHDKNLINKDLRKELHELRRQRNNFLHQCWLYAHRNNTQYLRKEVLRLAEVANLLVRKLVGDINSG